MFLAQNQVTMKEYLLLTFIATVGVVGLFNIHHEVRASQEQVPYFNSEVFGGIPVASKQDTSSQSQMSIDIDSAWPDIVIQVSHFDKNASYYLDSGNGERTLMTNHRQTLHYDHSGTKLIKLLKESMLIDVIELNVESNSGNARFASY